MATYFDPDFDLHCAAIDGIFYKDQLSLTNPRDALHHGERAANESGGRSV